MQQPVPKVSASDVARVLRREFAPALAAEAERLLARYSGPEEERVRLAVLREAGGTLEGLAERIRIANMDYRDALCAEYPRYIGLTDDADESMMRAAIEADWLEYRTWAGLEEADRIR